MRLELLLIFGILFFCCWCAFIVAKMNWSVALPAPPEAPAAQSPSSHQMQSNVQAAGPQISLLGQQIDLVHSNNHESQHNNNNNNNSVWRHSGHQQQPPVHSFARLIEASQPSIRFQEPPLAGAPGPPHPAPPPTSATGYLANNQLQAGAWLPAAHQWPVVSISARGQQPIIEATPGDQPDELEQANNNNNGAEDDIIGNNNNNNNEDSNEQDNQVIGASGDDEQEGGTNNDVDNDDDDQTANQEGGAGNETSKPGEEQEDEQQGQREEPDRAKEQREEASERRSFSEDLADSNERDRDGNLVVTNRSHLINGKPVEGASDRGAGKRGRRSDTKRQSAAAKDESEAKFDEPDEEEQEEEEEEEEENDSRMADSNEQRVKARKREQDREFDKVVSEIDRERDRRRKQTKGPGKQDKGDGQEVAAAATTTTTKTGKRAPKPGEPRKVISKRMMSKRTNKQHLPVIRPPDLHEHRLQETLSAQQWDDNSAGAGGEPPTGTGEELEAESQPDGSSDAGDIVDEDEEAQKLEALSRELLASPPDTTTTTTGGLDRRRRHVSGEIGTQVDSNGTNERVIFKPIGRNPLISSHESSGTFTSIEAANSNISVNNLASISDKGPIEWPVVARDLPDTLSGQEDISIEVLANPAPTGNLTNLVYQQQFGSPVAQSSGSNTLAGPPGPTAQPAPPVAFSYQPHMLVGSPFPQIGSPFASSSSHEKASMKKKSSKGKRKKSTANMEKYRSAKAHGKKMKSKRKKGRSSKKSHKEDERYSAKRKHFKGHSGGSKASKGVKANGANKGSDFFKDKGYKKKGFKKVYHKLESGDHKTYFDEFRDKDHKKKWKKFNDKSKYSKQKKWSAGDQKRLKQHKYNLAKGKSEKLGNYKQMESSKYTKKGHKLKEAKRVENSEGGSKKKKKKKKKQLKKSH